MRQKCDERRVHSLGRRALTPAGVTPSPSPAALSSLDSELPSTRSWPGCALTLGLCRRFSPFAGSRAWLSAGQPTSGCSWQSEAPFSAEARVRWCLSTRNSKLKSHFNIVGTLQALGLSHRRGLRVILVISALSQLATCPLRHQLVGGRLTSWDWRRADRSMDAQDSIQALLERCPGERWRGFFSFSGLTQAFGLCKFDQFNPVYR